MFYVPKTKKGSPLFPYPFYFPKENRKILCPFLVSICTQYKLRLIIAGLSLLPFVLSFPCYSKTVHIETKKTTWKQYWTRIALVNDPELFQSKRRKDRIASVTRTAPVKLSQLPDSESFFKKMNLKKKKLFQSISTIKNWNVHFHSWDKEKKVLFLTGTFLRGSKTVFFKEWYFYGKQYSPQILIEDTKKFNKTDQDIVALLDFLQKRMMAK